MVVTQSIRKIRSLISMVALFMLLVLMLIVASIPVSIFNRPNDLPKVKTPEAVTLINANIVDVRTGQVLPHRQIYIERGRITKISEVAIGDGVPAIDIQGAYVSPGLIDMHVHIHDRKDMVTNLAYGVTSVRNLRGFPAHLRWREELNTQQWLGASLFVSSPVLDGPKYAHALQQVVSNADHGRWLVNHYQQLGYDLIKVYGYLEPDAYSAIMSEAVSIGIPVAKHGPDSPTKDPYLWLDSVQSLEHVEDIFQGPLEFQFDEQLLTKYIQDIKPIQPYITPTLATFAHLTSLSTNKQSFVETIQLQQMNPFFKSLYGMASVERWLNATTELADYNQRELAFLQHITKSLSDQNIPLLVGSDAGTMYMTAGISTHIEMQLMQEADISAEKILRYATLNAAKSMQLEQEFGSVEAGRWADLILTKENPLEDISYLEKPLAVVKKGQYIDRDGLDELLISANHPDGYYIGFGILLEDLTKRWWTDLVH